jgi:hypothetical protein
MTGVGYRRSASGNGWRPQILCSSPLAIRSTLASRFLSQLPNSTAESSVPPFVVEGEEFAQRISREGGVAARLALQSKA